MDTTRQKGNRGKSCLAPLLILLVALPLFVYAVLVAAGALLIVGDPLVKSDIVVLLGGGDEQRMQEAVRIYMDRFATLLVLTETGEVDPRDGELYSALQKQDAMKLGVPSGGITFTAKHGNNTYDEAVAVRKMAEVNPGQINSIIVVTDPYHTLRTRLIYREVFRGSKVAVHVRPVRGHWYRSTTWFLRPDGWEMTLSEYAKIGAFFMGVRKD